METELLPKDLKGDVEFIHIEYLRGTRIILYPSPVS